jgi:hypothetical protein
MTETKSPAINWRHGAFRLWAVTSGLWCEAAILWPLFNSDKDLMWLPPVTGTAHVKISNTETWDYPAARGEQRIRDDLKKRLADKDEEGREWAARLPAAPRPSATPSRRRRRLASSPADCVKLFMGEFPHISTPNDGWEYQIRAVSAWSVIASAMPWAIGPPLALLTIGTSLFWAAAGFRHLK